MTSPPGFSPNDSPGIPFPPPLFFFVGIVVGAVVEKYVPSSLGPAELRDPIAIFLLAGGGIVSTSALAQFKETENDLRPDRPAKSLMTTGVYKYSRNPMYLSLAAMYASAAMLGNNLWMLLLLPVVVLAVHLQVIAREEAYLLRRFGDEYLNYCEKVRRWL